MGRTEDHSYPTIASVYRPHWMELESYFESFFFFFFLTCFEVEFC